MSFDAPHIMLLDEPTNHLDMDAREALMQALNNYNGAVILVSHDPHLVECVADRLWLVADGSCKPYEDDLDAYRTLVVQQRRREREQAKQQAKGNKEEGAPEAKKLNKSEKQAAKIEQKILDLSTRKDAMENEIATVSANGDAKQLKDLTISYQQLQEQLTKAEGELEALIATL